MPQKMFTPQQNAALRVGAAPLKFIVTRGGWRRRWSALVISRRRATASPHHAAAIYYLVPAQLYANRRGEPLDEWRLIYYSLFLLEKRLPG